MAPRRFEFALTQIDEYSYLFCSPTFVTDVTAPIRVQNMRISLNDTIPVSGQGFTTMNQLVTTNRQLLSRQCSVVGGLMDPVADRFELAFEQLGIFQDPVATSNPPDPGGEIFGEALPVLGVRSFARVNASMAVATGVDTESPEVDQVYGDLVGQLPSQADMRSFVSANQVGIAKLGTEYCDTLVEDDGPGGMRDAFFPDAASFGWNQLPVDAFDTAVEIDMITDPVLDKIVGAGLRGDLLGTPVRDMAEAALDQLVADLLTSCSDTDITRPDCDDVYTKSIVKGVCTAAVSSGALHIH